MQKSDTVYMDEKFRELQSDIRNISTEIRTLNRKLDILEGQNLTYQISELKSENKVQDTKIIDLQNSLNFYNGALKIIGFLLIPVYGALITLIIKLIQNN
jgi:hypothetical protein